MKLSKMANLYKMSYKMHMQKASDALKAKLLTIKEDSDSPLAEDEDVKFFIKSVITVAESQENES